MGSASSQNRNHKHIRKETKSGKYYKNSNRISWKSGHKVAINVQTASNSFNERNKNRTSVLGREIDFDNISQRLRRRSYSFPLQRDRTFQRNSSWLLVLEQNNAKRVLGILEHSKNLKTVGYKREKCISAAKRRDHLKNSNICYEEEDIQQPNNQYTSNALQEANIFQEYSNMFNTEDTRESNTMYKAENSRKTKDMDCIQRSKYDNGKEDFVKSESKEEIFEPFVTTCCIDNSKTAASKMDPDTIFETDPLGKSCIDCKSTVYKRTNIDKAWLPTMQQMGSISGVIHLNGKRTYFRNINKLKKEARFSSNKDSFMS